ncbi:transcription intermediary factor 1-alpha-like [Pecten maximus]|uniref:transcription intermediary factor 1-alpha-like n=1 Tax=Pecten maximus TaxID=6579 RepID=UPI0014584C7A|nr:transcription intermediary factor 1-alpha-like [Pecten maximus]
MIRAMDVQQEFLSCSICSENYDDEFHIPRVLPCLHTYCQVCLPKLSTNSVIICPVCNAKSRLPTSGVRGFPIDTTRRNFREFVKLKNDNSCIACNDCPDDNTASDFCKNCNIYLCLECKHIHRRSIASASHVILSIEVLKVSGPEVFQRCLKCTKVGHEGQPLAFFCSNMECRTLLCSTCLGQDHNSLNGHIVQNTEDARQLKLTEVKRLFGHLEDAVTLTRKLTEQLKQEILNIDIREFEMEKEVDATFAQIQAMLDERKADLKTDISKTFEKQRTALVSKSEKIGSFSDRVENAKTFSVNISRNCDPSEFLLLYNILQRRLKFLTRHEVNKSVQISTPAFDTQNVLTQFKAFVSTLGNISTETRTRNLTFFRNQTDLTSTSRPSSIKMVVDQHTDVQYPEIVLDKDTVHRYRVVSVCGRKLHSKSSSKKKPGHSLYSRKQLHTYRGGVGHRSFQRPGRFYFEVDININILKDLDNSNLVFEVGLCSLEEVDRGYYLYEQEHAWSLCGQHCERHNMVCRYLRHKGRNLHHTELMSSTVGTKVCARYGFLMDTDMDKLAVYDCQTHNRIFTFDDVGPGLELWPVLGCHWPSKVKVTMTLRSGRDIALPDVPVTRSFSMVI